VKDIAKKEMQPSNLNFELRVKINPSTSRKLDYVTGYNTDRIRAVKANSLGLQGDTLYTMCQRARVRIINTVGR
jgi:hypothetical protein